MDFIFHFQMEIFLSSKWENGKSREQLVLIHSKKKVEIFQMENFPKGKFSKMENGKWKMENGMFI